MLKRKSDVAHLLLDSLTSEQIADLLTVVFTSVDLNMYMEDIKKKDPDLAITVKRILDADKHSIRKGQTHRFASLKRTVEYWRSLWRNWDDIVSEVGQEDGRYAIQDRHWEPPYFDGWTLAGDLEPIARDMLSLIEDVYDEVDDENLFSKALVEIDDRIGSYPEWMGVENDEPCALKENVTECVLTWLWLSCRHQASPGQEFVGKVLSLENMLESVVLDDSEFTQFFDKLPDDVCREIYDFFKKADHLRVDLDAPYSSWHSVNHNYEKRFNPAVYLETCREYLTDNWKYGRPLVEDAVKRKDFHEAESFLGQTFSSYLGQRSNKRWCPETSLFLLETSYRLNESREEIASLLKIWGDISNKMNNMGRSAAAGFQAVVFLAPENWDRVLKEYQRLFNEKNQRLLTPLLNQWKNEMAARSYPYSLSPHKVEDTWIQWLIDALLYRNEKGQFANKLKMWMSGLKENVDAFRKQWHWLARLTKDLPDGEKTKDKYPAFYEAVLAEDDSGDDLVVSRRNGLRKMKVHSCLQTAMELWKQRLYYIVPDPVRAYQSNYEEHAMWAQALFELNREKYKALITQWRKKHKRRRNLWRDIKARRLPVD